jgi:AcrR family transcriptional regulator
VPRVRNPRGSGNQLRDDLLASALELLSAAADPDDVSIRAIARHTGVSATAAYRHFEDRDDLVYSATKLAYTQFANRIAEAVQSSKDPFSALDAAGKVYRDIASDDPGRYRVMFSNPMMCPEHLKDTADEDDTMDAFVQLIDLVQACLDAGASAATSTHNRPTDPGTSHAEYLAALLWTWIHGIMDLRITHPDHPWPDAANMFADASASLGLVPAE